MSIDVGKGKNLLGEIVATAITSSKPVQKAAAGAADVVERLPMPSSSQVLAYHTGTRAKTQKAVKITKALSPAEIFAKKREEYLSRLKTDSRNKENIENDIKAAEREYRIAKERFDDVCKKPGFFARIFGGEKVASKEEIQVAKNEMKFREDYLNNQKTKVVSYTTILQHNGEGDF